MQEKRRYPRYEIKLPLHFRKINQEGDQEKRLGRFWTKDVGLGGVRFETRESLELDTSLAIELHLPKKSFSDFVTQDPMQIQGRVAWSGRNRSEHQLFEVGIEFVAILEKDQKRIEECIRFFLEDEWDH